MRNPEISSKKEENSFFKNVVCAFKERYYVRTKSSVFRAGHSIEIHYKGDINIVSSQHMRNLSQIGKICSLRLFFELPRVLEGNNLCLHESVNKEVVDSPYEDDKKKFTVGNCKQKAAMRHLTDYYLFC